MTQVSIEKLEQLAEFYDIQYVGPYDDDTAAALRELLTIRRSAEPSGWQPMETMPEGEHILLYFQEGERGVGGIETATVYREDPQPHCGLAKCGYSFWTHGGPNSGGDWDSDEAPSHWMPLPPPPGSQQSEPKSPLPVSAVCEECGVAGRAPEGSVVTLWCNRNECPRASSVNRGAE